jgi:glucose-1-phosphate thymidylyltransferase
MVKNFVPAYASRMAMESRMNGEIRLSFWPEDLRLWPQMKGIILAGGAGSRLYPLTLVASKQLQPVYDKPMIYYPLTTLIEGGIRELCLISTPQDLPRFKQLLGDGSRFGLTVDYREQARPEGIAQAFLIAESFIGAQPVTLVLGDNIFYGGDAFTRAFGEFKSGATIFGYHVHDPERYGVVEFDATGKAVSIEEKPKHPKSNYAVPGLYIFDNEVVSIVKNLKPSARGELEITAVNVEYLRRGTLRVHRLARGFAWLDAGTSSSLNDASAYVQTIEKRAGIKIGCPEEAAFRQGFVALPALEKIVAAMPNCEYRNYLEHEVVAEAKRLTLL